MYLSDGMERGPRGVELQMRALFSVMSGDRKPSNYNARRLDFSLQVLV
jgi:hypothetical protein